MIAFSFCEVSICLNDVQTTAMNKKLAKHLRAENHVLFGIPVIIYYIYILLINLALRNVG